MLVSYFFCNLVLARYLAATLTVAKALKRHPHCDTECCLAVIMMLNDAAEDVTIYEHENDEGEDGQIQNKEPRDQNNTLV